MPQEQSIQGNAGKQESHEKKGLLGYLPVSFFGACMGLSAMCVAWHAMVELIPLSLIYSVKNWSLIAFYIIQIQFPPLADILSLIFAIFAVVAFVALSVAYSIKAMMSFESCKQEFLSPITRPFFATICISLLLLPFALQRLRIPEIIGFIVWILGAVLMLIFSVHIVQFWKCCPFRISWWAISFPLAAMCIASIKINTNIMNLSNANLPISFSTIHTLTTLFSILSLILLLSVTLVFVWLIVRTLLGIFRGELQNLA